MASELRQRGANAETAAAKPKVYYDTYGREFHLPDFSIKEIYDAIPQHCFKRDGLRGLSYVARDLAIVFTFGYLASFIHLLPSMPLRVAAYTVCQGFILTGLWVIAHECGHGAFSPSKQLNDTVGFILHSALLVPYFSWKFSHHRHHQQTGNLAKDTVFVPKTRSQRIVSSGGKVEDFPLAAPAGVEQEEHENAFIELVEETPIATALNLFFQQLGGWPMYLITNVTGPKYPGYSAKEVNHFWPLSPLFKSEQRFEIVLSDIGLAFAFTCLYFAVQRFGFAAVLSYYILPYLVVNSNLVGITFLQHTDPALPHYRENEWNFIRGATATIDRDFGWVGRNVLHHIMDTHVLHHLIARVPFYNAEEATVAVRKVMGNHYMRDDTNILVALYRAARTCQYVDDQGDVVFYHNVHGLGANADGHMNKPAAVTN